MHYRVSAVALAAALTVVAAAPVQATAAQSNRVVLSTGHVDALDFAYEDGEFGVSVHDQTDGQDVERDHRDVTFRVLPAARTAVPDDSRFRFLGRPGARVSILPQTQDEQLLFAGIATEEIPADTFQGNHITVRFSGVQGPDGFSLFTTDAGGNPSVVVDSEDHRPDVFTLETGTHHHFNWAFERPGTYRVKASAVATLASDGTRVATRPATMRIEVQR